jgi:hypothetical protein
MRTFLSIILILVNLFVILTACGQEHRLENDSYRDIKEVLFKGDCTVFYMKLENAHCTEGAFLVVTTGARFEYVPGELKIYQGLEHKRLVASMTIQGKPRFEMVERNDDHVALWSSELDIGIYGDSTCILAPKGKIDVRFTGHFKPDYQGRHKGELLLIDELGGIEIYPTRDDILLYDKLSFKRPETDYQVKNIKLGSKDWRAEYTFEAGKKIMVAAFPGRPFDWDRSFRSHYVITYGGMGLGVGNPYGQMPSEHTIKQWSKNMDIIVITHRGLYEVQTGEERTHPAGSYIVANEPEFRRLIRTAHKYGMKVAPYSSLGYHYGKFHSVESYYQQVKSLRDKYGIDGVYVDGLGYDQITRWETIRRLRQLFGHDGVLVYHGTGRGSPVATLPNVDTYCDVTVNGEGVAVKTHKDPYVQYQVRKYGISNTVGVWYNARKSELNWKDRIDAILEMNCRRHWGSYVPTDKPPPDNKYVWSTKQDAGYRYYFKKLEELKRKHLNEMEKSSKKQ